MKKVGCPLFNSLKNREIIGINNGEGRGTVPLYTIDKHLVRFFYQIEENKIIIKTIITLPFCTKLFLIKPPKIGQLRVVLPIISHHTKCFI